MVTAFPLIKDKINLTSGDIAPQLSRLVHCEEDGTLTINWVDGTTDTYTMIGGDDRLLSSTVDSVTITAGSFSFA